MYVYQRVWSVVRMVFHLSRWINGGTVYPNNDEGDVAMVRHG